MGSTPKVSLRTEELKMFIASWGLNIQWGYEVLVVNPELVVTIPDFVGSISIAVCSFWLLSQLLLCLSLP
jgi:hypothetical protein